MKMAEAEIELLEAFRSDVGPLVAAHDLSFHRSDSRSFVADTPDCRITVGLEWATIVTRLEWTGPHKCDMVSALVMQHVGWLLSVGDIREELMCQMRYLIAHYENALRRFRDTCEVSLSDSNTKENRLCDSVRSIANPMLAEFGLSFASPENQICIAEAPKCIIKIRAGASSVMTTLEPSVTEREVTPLPTLMGHVGRVFNDDDLSDEVRHHIQYLVSRYRNLLLPTSQDSQEFGG